MAPMPPPPPPLPARAAPPQTPSPLDYLAKNKAFVPGPGAYSVPDLGLPEGGRLHGPLQPPPPEKLFKPFCPEGGRCLQASKPPSYFDVAPKLFEGKPDPGRYEVQGSVQTKVVGRLVYRYESATIQESRALVRKATGVGCRAPGPGTYDLPEPPLLAQAPTVKGRLTPSSFVLPHPWVQKLAPDFRSASALAPVRQHNSAEQIFGTGLKRTAAGVLRPVKPRSQTPDGDQVEPRELPAAIGPPIDADMEEGVQWRSGGFASLRKAKSASALPAAPPPEHPSVEEAAKWYPKLAKKHNRANSTFLPMSSRRSETIATHDGSEEYRQIARGRWQLRAVAESIQAATAAALEPLDEAKLRDAALRRLKDKAMERMRLEGVAVAEQESFWDEMVDVLDERSQAYTSRSTGPSETDG